MQLHDLLAGLAGFGGAGVLATIPLTLDATEREGLSRSAGVLREAVASLNLS